MTDWGLFIDQRQEMIVARIAEILSIEGLIVTDGDIGDVALRIANSLVDRIDETFVGREFQTSIAFKDFFVHLGIYLSTQCAIKARLRMWASSMVLPGLMRTNWVRAPFWM